MISLRTQYKHSKLTRKPQMPKLTVQGIGEFEISAGKRLVQALTDDAGTDQLHACGGNSKCTTCRVKIVDGEPDKMTEAEQETLRAREVTDPGVRLSCQIACESDMTVELISRLEGSGRADQGSAVADSIQPEPVWTTR
jgi:ferredoxin